MGNAVPPRMCRKEPGAAAVAPSGRRRKNADAAAAPGAAPRRVAVCSRTRREGEEEEDEATRAGHRRAGAVSWADGAVGEASAAATGVTVKIVLKRKDAEALVARLNAQVARERKARMAELKGEFRAGDCGGGASPEPGRDAWKPSLAPINE
ncbi:hypothetical protein BS78_03G236900 [Paspalum vaginatum]|nr:hypothetical protein BS78_03G236900 [Paspalum vaginatum]